MNKSGKSHLVEVKAAVLACLIGVATILPNSWSLDERAEAGPGRHLESGYFEVEGSGKAKYALFDRSGVLVVTGTFGEVSGEWRLVGTAVCVSFPFGPKADERCEPIVPTHAGGFRIGDMELRKRANGLVF